ncbi:hypothetical protein ELX74_24610 [Escherichia coli]|nr:hypothetical protein [Escherichia coli]EFC9518102.1 hypothetical protein [Escherichia coli]MJE15679.1 hypothetical protein [Escherichia coli]TFL36128.1 hypothetical protein ELY49_27025 [Escherichia coli]TFL49796.1 hypothetical protein ELY32_25255 [Escherichia coli]
MEKVISRTRYNLTPAEPEAFCGRSPAGRTDDKFYACGSSLVT